MFHLFERLDDDSVHFEEAQGKVQFHAGDMQRPSQKTGAEEIDDHLERFCGEIEDEKLFFRIVKLLKPIFLSKERVWRSLLNEFVADFK